jgi:hypothetical protein
VHYMRRAGGQAVRRAGRRAGRQAGGQAGRRCVYRPGIQRSIRHQLVLREIRLDAAGAGTYHDVAASELHTHAALGGGAGAGMLCKGGTVVKLTGATLPHSWARAWGSTAWVRCE